MDQDLFSFLTVLLSVFKARLHIQSAVTCLFIFRVFVGSRYIFGLATKIHTKNASDRFFLLSKTLKDTLGVFWIKDTSSTETNSKSQSLYQRLVYDNIRTN